VRQFVKEFREFALKGNLVDLAVAIVLGVAFAAVVGSLVDDVVMNVIAAMVGEPDFSELVFTLNGARIGYGAFLTELANFALIAFVLFLLVKAINRLQRRHETAPTERNCPYCLTSIPNEATRCAACTSEVEPVAA
jgi:large conductance mechanosensitive channel